MLPHNRRIFEFYRQYCGAEGEAGNGLPAGSFPLFYPGFVPRGTLVIGFNPSLAPAEEKKLKNFPALTDRTAAAVEALGMPMQEEAHRTLRFFRQRHEALDGKVPMPLQHYDLFPIRLSHQRSLERALSLAHIRAGVAMLGKLVEQISPEVVWIANKGVWRVMSRSFEKGAGIAAVPLLRERPKRVFAVHGLYRDTKVVVTNSFTSQFPQNLHSPAELQTVFAHLASP